jgi:hypothetical protein
MTLLIPGLAVVTIIDADDREIGWVDYGYRCERADIHQQLAVAGHDEHAPVGTSERETETDRRPRLDRCRHEAVVDELDLDDVGRADKSRCDGIPVSPLKSETEVSRSFVPDRGRAGQQRRRSLDDRVERPVFDRNPLGGVTRPIAAFGHHQRHRIADMTHPPPRQRITRRHDHRIDRADLRDAGEGTDTVRPQIALGEDPEDPAPLPHRRGVDPLYRGMRMQRPHYMGIELLWQSEIVDVAATSGQKPEILEPADRALTIVGLHLHLFPCNGGRMAR